MEVLGVDNLGIFDWLGTINHKQSQSTWKREHKRSWGSAKSPILAILDACWLAQSISELDSYQQDINRINSKSETALGIMIDTDFWTAIRGFISEFGLFSWRVLSGQPTPCQAPLGSIKRVWEGWKNDGDDFIHLGLSATYNMASSEMIIHLWCSHLEKGLLFVCVSLTSQTVS